MDRRLFTAIPADDQLKKDLTETIEQLQTVGDFRPTDLDKLHLTLIYIGRTRRTRSVDRALQTLVHEPLVLDFAKPKVISQNEGLLIWQEVELSPELESLHTQVNDILCWQGFCSPNLHFTPHITLGRRFTPYDGVELTDELLMCPTPRQMAVDYIGLYESKKDADGRLVYEEINRYPLEK